MNKLIVIMFILLSIVLTSCDSDSTDPETTGQVRVYVTDAPAVYDEVNITFSEVSAHKDSAWITIEDDPVTINLLDFSNGDFYVLGDSELPTGKYTQIRIAISSANVVVAGVTYPLTVPSDKLRFGPEFTVEANTLYELVLDFDASRSVVLTGSGSYKLKPVIRVTPEAITGMISGTVSNNEHFPIAFAIQGSDTVTSSIANEDGYFVLGFLAEGNYEVHVSDTLNQTYINNSVNVNVGQTTDLGEIRLQ